MEVGLVIFDMDGLMFDTEQIYKRAWEKTMAANGYPFGWEVYIQLVARNSRTIGLTLKRIYGEDFPFDRINGERRAAADALIEEEGIGHKEGLLELLDYLDEKGIKKIVATSSAREKALRYLKIGQVAERFEQIICGSDVKEAKPNPEIFHKAADVYGVPTSKCVVLEDSKMGIKAARAAQMYGIFIPDLVAVDEEVIEASHQQLKSLREVKAWLMTN